MAVEAKKPLAAEHGIVLTNRSALSATGIEDVVCFTDEKIELKTPKAGKIFYFRTKRSCFI